MTRFKSIISMEDGWTVAGSLGLARSSSRRLRAMPATQASLFAEALMRRHAERCAVSQKAEMILSRLLPAARERTLHQHMHLRLSPQLNLTVLNSSGRPETPASGAHAPALAFDAAREPQPPVATFIRRFIEREVRLDSVARAEAPMASAQLKGAAPQAAPLPQSIVRRGAPRAETPEQAPRPDAPGQYRAHAPRPEAAPAVDINGLTNQVIQALDRRIIAHRERLGRI